MNNNNINIVIDENSNNEELNNTELESLLKEIEYAHVNDFLMYQNNVNYSSKMLAKSMDYEMNYTIKQLIRICDYYGITKDIKANKLKKDEIISFLIDFEENENNTMIVYKREQFWYYMNEMKNDKFMKKFLLLW
uniref:Uncharacterized protein n=2 Tax=viral metagenome TaxID=1070528 RepID=A0A6C0DHD4_9ZZZZ